MPEVRTQLQQLTNNVDKLTYLYNIKAAFIRNYGLPSVLSQLDKVPTFYKFFTTQLQNEIDLIETFQRTGLLTTRQQSATNCKLSTLYSEQCLSDIHRYLTTTSQGSPKLTIRLDNWLAWFDLKNIDNIEPMKWNATKTMLSNIMLKVCGSEQKAAIKEAFGLSPETKLSPDSKGKFNRSTVGIAIQSIIDRYTQQSI